MRKTRIPDSSQGRPETAPEATLQATRKPRRWLLPTLLTLAGLTALFLTLLPVAIQYGLQDWLLKNGAQHAEIMDVDLNLFSGRAQLEGVRIEVDGHPSLTLDSIGLDFAWQGLLQRHISLTGIHLRGAHLDIQQGNHTELRIGGILLPTLGRGDALEQKVAKAEQALASTAEDKTIADWGIGIDALSLTDVSIHLTTPELQIDTQIQQLSLSNLAQWSPDTPAQIALQASINGAALSYNGGIAPFADTLLVDGQLTLRELALADYRQIARLAADDKLAGALSLKTAFTLQLGEQGMVVELQDSELQLRQLHLVMSDIQLQQQVLRWAGDLNLTRTDRVQLQGHGQLSTQQLVLQLPAQKLAISQQALQLGVEIDFQQTDGDPVIHLQLDETRLDELAISTDGFPLAGLQQLRMEALTFHSPQALSIAQIVVDRLTLAQLDDGDTASGKNATPALSPALFSNRNLRIEKLALTETQALSVDKILLRGAHVYIRRAADEATNIDELLAAVRGLSGDAAGTTGSNNTAAAETPATTKDSGTFTIGHIQISDDSTIVIDDTSVTPTTRIDIGITELSVDNLDNRQPDTLTQVRARGKFGRFGSYALSGDIQPFADTTNARLSADIQGIDLPRLSPYTTRSLGFRLRSGTLATTLDVTIVQDQISGNSELTLQQLELIPLEDSNTPSGDLSAASINTSLNMLRDKNNTIVLKIPLSGDINAPDFSIQNVLHQALMSGVQTGVMTYALLALQPYGTMVVLAKYAGEAVTKLRLDPVTFDPASSEISATGKDYLSKVATILIDRPKVAVKVCGVAVKRDATALRAALQKRDENRANTGPPLGDEQLATALKQLARQRAIAVREFLISQAAGASSQLVGCMPTIEQGGDEGEADALPRADLLI